ncbi:MAG: Uma2 family endonuclease [Sphingomonas bacterium]
MLFTMMEFLPLNTSPLSVKLRVEDYLLLDESGALEAYRKTELIEVKLYFINAQHRPHALAKAELYDALRDALRDLDSPLRPLTEASIDLSSYDAPEPDIVLTSEPRGEGLIPLASVALIVEISDTTVSGDLKRKASIYARAGVPEYWVVDLNARLIHQLWAPRDDAYAERRQIAFGERLDAVTIAGLALETSAL